MSDMNKSRFDFNKAMRAGVAALAVLGGSVGLTSTAEAQTAQTDPAMANAEIRMERARLNVQISSCNSRALSRGQRNNAAIAAWSQGQACQKTAEARYLYRVARIERKYGYDFHPTLERAFATDQQAIRLRYDAAITTCSTQFYNNATRRNGNFVGSAARADGCQAQAQARALREQVQSQRNYNNAMR